MSIYQFSVTTASREQQSLSNHEGKLKDDIEKLIVQVKDHGQ